MKTRRQHHPSKEGWEGGSTGVQDHGMYARIAQELGRSSLLYPVRKDWAMREQSLTKERHG